MPLPSPNKGEKRSDFVSRCVSMLSNKGEGKDAKQRVAICHSQYQSAKASETKDSFMSMANCGQDHSKLDKGKKCPSCDYKAE